MRRDKTDVDWDDLPLPSSDMDRHDQLGFEDIFQDLTSREENEFGLRRQMRFISERIIAEYCPDDCLSVREIMHPMDPFRTFQPFFQRQLADKAKREYVTAIDFHEHITYFPYAKNTGDICLARYISNFNDRNFTKISGQILCNFPGETVHGLRVGRMDKGLLAVNHRTGNSVNSTVTVMDLVKPARNLAYFDSYYPVNTIDWIWHGQYHLAIGDDKAFRVVDIRCPKSIDAVFFEGGVLRTALTPTRPTEIACWNGSYVLLYDIRRPDVPSNVVDIGLKPDETMWDMKFNPYITKELFVHTSKYRVLAMNVEPATLLCGQTLSDIDINKWEIITFKHIDRSCTAHRHSLERKEKLPVEEAEVQLLDYSEQYEASKVDPDIAVPSIWRLPDEVDETIFSKLSGISEIDFESYLTKAVERVSAEIDNFKKTPKHIYEAEAVETFDFVFPGVNGIMCFDRINYTYKLVRSPKHYEGCLNHYAGSDSVYYYRGLQMQEMIPAQTLTMFCERLKDGWNAYQTSERSLRELAFKITEGSNCLWTKWLRNMVKLQYSANEFTQVGQGDMCWNELIPSIDGPLPVVEIPPWEQPKEKEAAEEICQMVAPFFRLFLPDPRPDLLSDSESDSEDRSAPPPNPYEELEHPETDLPSKLPAELSTNMRTLCKCHAKIRYYNKKRFERQYMYTSAGSTFFISASERIREKFWRLSWHPVSKRQVLADRMNIDARIDRRTLHDNLKRFQRFKPREFQKRVLPPKLITESTSIFMKPEYIKEKEDRERAIREKHANIEAPVGLSVAEPNAKPGQDAAKRRIVNPAAALLPPASADDDPEKTRFLIRAARQLADNDSSDEETPPPPPPKPEPPKPSGIVIPTKEKDDFKYETAEDAYFGIKKKRMYVVYQPATIPLGLRRYRPDRLGENTFVRRLEHLMYHGARTHERRVLYGRYEENDKRQSSVKERQTLDLKFALRAHKRVGWQTFYDAYFFFSKHCSYNQLLRKLIQVYNATCWPGISADYIESFTQERMICGVKPRLEDDYRAMKEARRLRTELVMIPTTINMYNQFMNYLQSELPQYLDHTILCEDFSPGDELPDQHYPRESIRPTAKYDERDKFMFPIGKLRFCEVDIPPGIMREVFFRRIGRDVLMPELKNNKEAEFPTGSSKDAAPLPPSSSCLDLAADESQYDDVIITKGARELERRVSNIPELKTAGRSVTYVYIDDGTDEEEMDWDDEKSSGEICSEQSRGNYRMMSFKRVEHLSRKNFTVLPTIPEWDSPMIADVDEMTGEGFLKRVVPFPPPQPPRQITQIEKFFEDISADVRRYAPTSHTYHVFDEPDYICYVGLQVLDKYGVDSFNETTEIPIIKKANRKIEMEFVSRNALWNVVLNGSHNSHSSLTGGSYEYGYSSDTILNSRVFTAIHSRARTPIFEEHSTIHIPTDIIDLMKPSYYGYFWTPIKERYTVQELAEMRTRREFQLEIIQKRRLRFREPLVEETEHELKAEKEHDVQLQNYDFENYDGVRERRGVRKIRPVKPTGSEILDFMTMFENIGRYDFESDSESEMESGRFVPKKSPPRKFGVFGGSGREAVFCTRYNPHTRENIRRSAQNNDDHRYLGRVLNKVYAEHLTRQRELGYNCPLGSPKKRNANNANKLRSILAPINDVLPKVKSRVTWGSVTKHVDNRHVKKRNQKFTDWSELDVEFFSKTYGKELKSSLKKPSGKSKNARTKRKNSDPTAVKRRGIPRRASLDSFERRESISGTCTSCVSEPWPVKEVCIVCHPTTTIYQCTNILHITETCHKCNNNLYKFSCMNYELHSRFLRETMIRTKEWKLRSVNEKFVAMATTADRKEETELIARWAQVPYKSGDYAVDSLLENCEDQTFNKSQETHLTGFFHREFQSITWLMDDEKSEKVFVSEEFDVAFNRDADIDIMRDTMNTISQDGQMDMMTTYDQRNGMRIRRWISYAALNTRIQKQEEKVRQRKRAAEREARILAGEISVKPALFTEIKKKAKEKEEQSQKSKEEDEAKKAEERRREYKAWKKLPIPEFIEDPKKEMPNFTLPKKEDWLESSGSEDELPPIRSRIQSKEIKEFIATIRKHMERKPAKFDGLRVVYGKLFEKRPILKNDIVLVTKRNRIRRAPPQFKVERIPLDEAWKDDSLRVSFLPTPQQPFIPKDANKWTLPFYISENLALTAKETKDRAFRPPTPPLELKREYEWMKHFERLHYRKKHHKKLTSQRKAHIARQMRFRRKLIGGAQLSLQNKTNRRLKPRTTWTIARRRMNHLKHIADDVVTSKLVLPKISMSRKYVFSYQKRRTAKRLKLSRRELSKPSSSSDSEKCLFVRSSSLEKKPKPSQPPKVPKRKPMVHKEPMGLLARKKKELQKASFLETSKISNTMKLPETGQLVRRESTPDVTKSLVSQFPINRNQTAKQNKHDVTMPETESEQAFKKAELTALNNTSKMMWKSTPVVTLRDNHATRRNGRDETHKVTATSVTPVPKERLPLLLQSSSQRDIVPVIFKNKVIERRTQSEVPVLLRNNKSCILRRSFSVDRGSFLQKTVRRLVKRKERETKNRLPVIPSFVVKRVSFAKSVQQEEPLRKSPSFGSSHQQKKEIQTPGEPIPKVSRAGNVHRKRPFQMRWLPSAHETDKGDHSDSQHQFQQMRMKRYCKNQKPLHRAPTRSKVLNAVRKIKATEEKNKEMTFENPIEPKTADLFLRPQIPFPTSRLRCNSIEKVEPEVRKSGARTKNDKVKGNHERRRSKRESNGTGKVKTKTGKEEPNVKKAYRKTRKVRPMSWTRFLKRVSHFGLDIKRVRAIGSKKFGKIRCSSEEEDSKPLEIVVKQTPDLKPSLKKGKERRVLKLFTARPAEKQEPFGFGNAPLRFLRTPTSVASLDEPSPPRASQTVPSLRDLHTGDVRRTDGLLAIAGNQQRVEWPTGPLPRPEGALSILIEKQDETDGNESIGEEKKESETMIIPLRLLKPVTTLLYPEDYEYDKREGSSASESSSASSVSSEIMPPPKLPADQQWRAAMMSRRAMGMNRPLFAPTPQQKEVPKLEPPTPPTEPSVPASGEGPTKSIPAAQASIERPPEEVPATVPTPIKKITVARQEKKKAYEPPVAKPKATAPPPAPTKKQQEDPPAGVPVAPEKTQPHEQPSSSQTLNILIDQEVGSTPSVSQTPAQNKESTSETVAVSRAQQDNSAASSGQTSTPLAEQPAKRTLFQRLFGSTKKIQAPNIVSTVTPQSPLSMANSMTSPPIRTPTPPKQPEEVPKPAPEALVSEGPLLPRIKLPESGKLEKKVYEKPPQPKPVTSRVVKIVGGKPVHNAPAYKRPKPPPPPPPPPPKPEPEPAPKPCNLSDEEDFPIYGNRAVDMPTVEIANFFEVHPIPPHILEAQKKSAERKAIEEKRAQDLADRRAGKPMILTSVLKTPSTDSEREGSPKSSGKSVTFGPIHHFEPSPSPPRPVVPTSYEIALALLPDLPIVPNPPIPLSPTPLEPEVFNPPPKKKKPQKKTESAETPILSAQPSAPTSEHTSVIEQVVPIVVVEPTASVVQVTAQQDKPLLQKSNFTFNFGKTAPNKPTQPLSTAGSSAEPSTSGTRPLLQTSPTNKSQESSSDERNGNRPKAIRKTSKRRQFKMGDPSALQLSGDASLPKPAEPAPDEPPHLELPKEVKHYKPLSERKYFTRHGQEWHPPSNRRPEVNEDSQSAHPAPVGVPESEEQRLVTPEPSPPPPPPPKKRKLVKRVPEPQEITLVLDGTERLGELTATNLELLDREFDVKRRKRASSVRPLGGDQEFTKSLHPREVIQEYSKLKETLRKPSKGETTDVHTAFHLAFDNLVTVKKKPANEISKKPKYETVRMKLKRMRRNRKQKVKQSGLKPLSKRRTANSVVRQYKKIRFRQLNKKLLMPALPIDFQPKSILKLPKPPVKWWYRIDSDGNKRYLKSFGPSVWQKKVEDSNLDSATIPVFKKKKVMARSYLKCWSKVMVKIGEDQLERMAIEQKDRANYFKIRRTRDERKPEDIIVEEPMLDGHPPSRSLSWISVTASESLESLLEEAPPLESDVDHEDKSPPAQEGDPEVTGEEDAEVGQEAGIASDTFEASLLALAEAAEVPEEMSRTDELKEAVEPVESENGLSKKFPLVYIGMTVARSPSTSVSNVPETISSVAQDGSQIVEFVGQEESTRTTVQRRLDPFVRPISQLFQSAFRSNPTELGTEAEDNSRSRLRNRFSSLFRRGLPQMPELSARPVSSSPPRRRGVNGLQVASMSRGSSAEDILALTQNHPSKSVAKEESSFPPLELPDKLPAGQPMFAPKKKLSFSLYDQLNEQKKESKQKKIDEYYNQKYEMNPAFNFTTVRKLINFNVDEYLRINRYPRPVLDFKLLGKYSPDSIKVNGCSRKDSEKTVALIVKKLEKCRERIEKAKKFVKSSSSRNYTNQELTAQAKKIITNVAKKKPRKIRVQYKFKKSCIKYRVEVTISEKIKDRVLRDLDRIRQAKRDKEDRRPPVILTVHADDKTTVQPDEENQIGAEPISNVDDVNKEVVPTDYDGDDDGEVESQKHIENRLFVASKQIVARKSQRRALLRHYFHFAIRMARKVARRSLGAKKPLVFYAYISQIKNRMGHFMEMRLQDNRKADRNRKKTNFVARNGKKAKKVAINEKNQPWFTECVSARKPPLIRKSLKHGFTVRKPVILKNSKFTMLKANARLEAFFVCLDEYIDVGTPIKLLYKSSNSILPKPVFDPKSNQVDTDYYVSPSPNETDSDFSSDTPENPKLVRKRRFFKRRTLESTFHVKGLPGLIYLARLVEEQVGEEIEKNIPFCGPLLEDTQLVVYSSPIRRLMLTSMGLRMPDRLRRLSLAKHETEPFELWFSRLFRVFCYGRGDLIFYCVDKIRGGQGLPRSCYDKLDVGAQAHIIYKLYRKMTYLKNGREGKLALRELIDRGLDLEEENPYAKKFRMGMYDHWLPADEFPWTDEQWLIHCDHYLEISEDNENAYPMFRASLMCLRMLFLSGYPQDIVDCIIPLNIAVQDKMLFVINLSSREMLVENIVKMFHTTRGLDRLAFVGLGYHADPLRVLFEEAVESGDPQLVSHIIRVGRCLDRRSGKPMMTDCDSQHIKNRDFAQIMTDIFTNYNEKMPRGAPTMDEMFPYRYVRRQDGSTVPESTEELAKIMECEVTRYMAILELTKGAAVTKGDLDHNKRFNKLPMRYFSEILCTGCKMNVAQGRHLGRLGRVICVSTMPLIEQDKDRKRWPDAKSMSPKLYYENYIESLDPTENKMLMARDIEEEKTDITVQILPSRFGCFNCRFQLPRCSVCMCSLFNDHEDYALKEKNDSFSQFSVCNICNHGGHVHHLAKWFATEKFCPVNGCDCRCSRAKEVRNLKARLSLHMLLSTNMRAKSHLCNPQCGVETDIDEGYLPDPDVELYGYSGPPGYEATYY